MFMLSVKYYFISLQQAYNIFLALYCPNCSTFDIPQVPMCAKKTKLNIRNLKFIMCISFKPCTTYIQRIKVHLSQEDRRHPSY